MKTNESISLSSWTTHWNASQQNFTSTQAPPSSELPCASWLHPFTHTHTHTHTRHIGKAWCGRESTKRVNTDTWRVIWWPSDVRHHRDRICERKPRSLRLHRWILSQVSLIETLHFSLYISYTLQVEIYNRRGTAPVLVVPNSYYSTGAVLAKSRQNTGGVSAQY